MEGEQVILLDTCAIVWDALWPSRLSERARKAILAANAGDGILFCEISLWEIAMLIKKRRVVVPVDYLSFVNTVLASNRYVLKGITPGIADAAVNLPEEAPADPADRLIVATAIAERATLVTADTHIRRSSLVDIIW